MSESIALRIDGQVERPLELTWDDLHAIEPQKQIANLPALGYSRSGVAIPLTHLLAAAKVNEQATHLGLHASRDDFHASIPLDAVLGRGLLVFAHEGREIPESEGGPLRFFIPDHTACKMGEVDECANVKFVDQIELTMGKGRDNRPADENEHRRLHAKE